MNETYRKRLEKRILRLIAELTHKSLKDPDIGFTTFTKCELSSDGAYAKVYLSVYEKKEDQMKTIKALSRGEGFIRHRIAKNIPMRIIPRISFFLDESFDVADKINDMIDGNIQNQTEEE